MTKKKNKLITILLLLALCIIPTRHAFAQIPNSVATTLYIDANKTGNFDCFLIGKNGNYMLVDTGRLGDINNLFYMLEQRNVKHIKALVMEMVFGFSQQGLTPTAISLWLLM